jgi:hypothetical protein
MKQAHSVNKAALRRETVMQEEAALAEHEHAEEKLPGGIASKSAFIDQLTAAIESTADPILAKKGRSSANCPWIKFVKAFYRFHSTKDLVKAIRRFAPETAHVSDPAEMIELVSQRVAASVNTWVQTGEVTGLPQEVENRLPPSLKKKDKKDASQVHNQLEGEGHGMEGSIKSMMESALGADFSEVKVHTGAKGAEIAKDNDAKALAVGQHIAFGEGEYQPGTLAGDALLAHELAHTQQQKGADITQAQEQGPESAYEEEADEMAEGAMMGIWGKAKKLGKKVKNGLKSGLQVQRCRPDEAAKNQADMADTIQTDTIKTDTLTTTATPDPAGKEKPDSQLTYEEWKKKHTTKLKEVRDIQQTGAIQLKINAENDHLSEVYKTTLPAKIKQRNKMIDAAKGIKGFPETQDISELDAPENLSTDRLTEIKNRETADRDIIIGLNIKTQKFLVPSYNELIKAIGNIISEREKISNLKEEKKDRPNVVGKYDEGFLSEGVWMILNEIRDDHGVDITPEDMRALMQQEHRDDPDPTRKSNMGALGLAQITSDGLKGAKNWMNSKDRVWYLDTARKKSYDERMKKYAEDKNPKKAPYKKTSEDIAVEKLIKEREKLVLTGDERASTTKAQQLMAACLGSALLDMQQSTTYGPYLDEMKKNGNNIQVKMMLFASYNAGATGAISKFKKANDEKTGGTFNWLDAKSKFSEQTKEYVPGVAARLPISELKGLKELDLSDAFRSGDKNIMEMPTGYGVLTELEKLDLSGNRFNTLPEDLKKLVNLQALNLSGNNLSNFNIISFIKNMTFLTDLNLANNGFSDKQITDITAKLKTEHPRLTVTFK